MKKLEELIDAFIGFVRAIFMGPAKSKKDAPLVKKLDARLVRNVNRLTRAHKKELSSEGVATPEQMNAYAKDTHTSQSAYIKFALELMSRIENVREGGSCRSELMTLRGVFGDQVDVLQEKSSSKGTTLSHIRDRKDGIVKMLEAIQDNRASSDDFNEVFVFKGKKASLKKFNKNVDSLIKPKATEEAGPSTLTLG